MTYRDQGSVARIAIDDGRTNALDPGTVHELHAALDRAEERGARALVLEGCEGVFSSGVDYRALVEFPAHGRREFAREYRRLLLRVFRFPRPTVAAVTGHAIGGGALLALACDVRWGARGRFQFGFREVTLGLPTPTFAVEIVCSQLVATHHARCLAFGDLLPPLEARRAGLVQRLVQPGDLLDSAVADASRLAALPASAFAATKSALRARAMAAAALREEEDVELLVAELPGSLASEDALPVLERRERPRADMTPPTSS